MHAVGTEGDRLDDVAAAPHAAVADDLDASTDLVGDGRDEVEGSRSVVELTAAVVGQGDGFDPDVGGDPCVVDGLDALDDDRPAPHRAEPLDVVPRQAGVELGGERVGEVHGRVPSG